MVPVPVMVPVVVVVLIDKGNDVFGRHLTNLVPAKNKKKKSMGLIIKKADDYVSVKGSVTLLYGEPGSKKTSYFFTAKKPYLFDFEGGIRRVDAKYRGDWGPVESWSDIMNVTAEDLADYDTIGFDSVGRMIDLLSEHIMSIYPTYRQPDGSIALKGWGAVKSAYRAFMFKYIAMGKDLIFIAHSNEETKGQKTVNRPDIPGASKKAIINDADLVGFVQIIQNKSTVCWTPTDEYFGKNSCGLPGKMAMEKSPLSEVIPLFKDSVNAKSGEYQTYKTQVREWIELINNSKTSTEWRSIVEQFGQKSDWSLSASMEVWEEILAVGGTLGYFYENMKWVKRLPETPMPEQHAFNQ